MPGLSASRQDPNWLVDYDVGGHVYRFATTPTTVTGRNGTTYRYEAGLAPLETGLVRTFGAREMELQIDSQIDWAKIEARGIALESRRVIVRLHYSGEILEQCDQVLDGWVEGVAYSVVGEPLMLTVVGDIERGASVLPGAQGVASDETWPVRGGYTLASSAEGKTYPIPVGYPGDHPKPGGTDVGEPAYPCLWIEVGTDDRFLHAVGRIDAAQVVLWTDIAGAVQSYNDATAETTDSRGTLITYSETDVLTSDDKNEFFVGFRNASGFGGGILSPYTGGVLRGAGEVWRYFIDYFTDAKIDHARVLANQAFFDRFKIDAVIGMKGSEKVSDFLQRAVMDHLPAMMVDGPNGLYLAPMRWDAEKHHRVAHIDIDAGHASIVGTITKWDEPVYNRFTIEYRPRWGNLYVSRRELTAIELVTAASLTGGARFPPLSTSLPWIASAESDTRVAGSSLLRASQTRFGLLEHDVIQLASCWDDDTANLILWYKAAQYAWPKRIGRIEGPHLSTLMPGDIFTITSASHYLDEAIAMVIERPIGMAGVHVDFVLLDHPARTQRQTT